MEIRAMEKRFGGRQVLGGVSFELQSGVTGLLGPNGAGKTTLLRCMLGIIRPSAGSIVFDESCPASDREIGYLPQRFGLLKELTVTEALTYFAALKRIPSTEYDTEIERCLQLVNLTEAAAARVGTLSGGMLRRVGIASVLLGSPAVLVFDEPTAGLDPEERVRFKRLVSTLAENHTILISTHIVEDIQAVADRVVVLVDGTVRANGSLDDIAKLASGKTYLAPRDRVNEFSDSYYVDRYIEVEGAQFARVLSPTQLDGFIPDEPTVEDGYLCVTRGLV